MEEHDNLKCSNIQLNNDTTYRRIIQGIGAEQAAKLDFIPELYYDEKAVQKRKEDLLELKLNLDACIDKANHATKITF